MTASSSVVVLLSIPPAVCSSNVRFLPLALVPLIPLLAGPTAALLLLVKTIQHAVHGIVGTPCSL
jgi:hypothetical protein